MRRVEFFMAYVVRRLSASLLATALWATGGVTTFAPSVSLAQAVAPERVAADLAPWVDSVWSTARNRNQDAVVASLSKLPAESENPNAASVRDAVDHLKKNLAQREADRATQSAELSKTLDETLATAASDTELSKALRSAVELELLANDRAAFVKEPRISRLIEKAESAARAAERRADWLVASELFFRLHALLEETGQFKKDSDRLGQRLGMLRLYVPKRLWELRNQRQIAAAEDPLPPYNPIGDDYAVKLRAVDEVLILRALAYVPQHVEQVALNKVLAAGLEAVRTMVTTSDLSHEFPGLDQPDQVATFTKYLDEQIITVQNLPGLADYQRQYALLSQLLARNDATVSLPRTALLHEFGNGMMVALDEFSAIIWPDELRRFQRNTQGKLVGIGVSIEFDPQSNVRVVAPIEGTPAQRAGIHAGDIIKKVNGAATYGMSLDQAVDVITGPANSEVTLTIEREEDQGKDADGKSVTVKRDIDFTLTRAIIDIVTVKGWKRNGIREDDWDWFVDRDAGIGYVRLTQFTDTTTRDFDRAVSLMQTAGLNGMILDLRFNPGGLLDQAVEIVRRFVDVERGEVVMMAGRGGGVVEGSQEFTRPARAKLAKTPIIVLINENSASASEIVSGALKFYGSNPAPNGGPNSKPAIDCLVLGERSFGKGSVQNVWPMTQTQGSNPNAAMKLTIQYYMLPDRKIIHRKIGSEVWGVEPNLRVDMLPKQTSESLLLRRNADILAINENGQVTDTKTERPNPDDLIAKGLDPQLEMAVVLLKSKAAAQPPARVAREPR